MGARVCCKAQLSLFLIENICVNLFVLVLKRFNVFLESHCICNGPKYLISLIMGLNCC